MARMTAIKLLELWIKQAKPIWSGTEWRPNCGGDHKCPFCGSSSGYTYQTTFPMDELAHGNDCFYIESKRFLQKAKDRKDKRVKIK